MFLAFKTAFRPLKRPEEDNDEISNFGAKTEAAGTKTKESFRVKFSCQIKAAGHLEALRTPTDVWEAGGHIWEVVRTQGGHPSSPGSPEKRQRLSESPGGRRGLVSGRQTQSERG